MKPGDQVRCTLGDNVLVGTIGNVLPDCRFSIATVGFSAVLIDPDTWTVEILNPPLPPEPPVGSVVMDGNGATYHRWNDWWRCHRSGGDFSWAELVKQRGSLILLVPATQIIQDVKQHECGERIAGFLAEKYGVTT